MDCLHFICGVTFFGVVFNLMVGAVVVVMLNVTTSHSQRSTDIGITVIMLH